MVQWLSHAQLFVFHGLKHTRLPCPSVSPGVHSHSFSLSQWFYLNISSSATHFFCIRSFLAWGSFPMSELFPSGGQSIGTSASASVLPMNIQGWFPWIDWFGLLAVQETLKSLLQHHSSKGSTLPHSAFFMFQLSHPSMTTGKTIALTRQTFVGILMFSSTFLHKRGFSYLSLIFSGTLHSVEYIFPVLPCLLLLFFCQLF